MIASAYKALEQLRRADRLWLFLDYDGTLAEFAPTPDIVEPDQELIMLLSRLAQKPDLRLAVISGRRLGHIRRLIPIPGIWLAGTYGIELLTPSGEQKNQLDYGSIRPALDDLKTRWEKLTTSRSGFYLEDKGWALAIHANFASEKDARDILQAASYQAQETVRETDLRLQGGYKFLELCPADADKGKALDYILSLDAFHEALPVFIGDDDKDERAFSTVKDHLGIGIVVAAEARQTHADFCLKNPAAVRAWLTGILSTRYS